MNKECADKIAVFMDKYAEHFDELRTFINTKQQKVTADDLLWLYDSLNEEQRLVMRGNAMESQRLALLEELGLSTYTGKQIIEEAPEEYAGRLRVSIDKINDAVVYVKETNERILDMIERKLTVQAEALNKATIAGANTYTPKGTKVHKNTLAGEGDFLGSV